MTDPVATIPKSRGERRIAGWRLAALIEIAAFLGLALLVDWYFFAGDRFINVQPHPFWIIVLLVAAQYGTSEALVATVAATAALLIGNLPPQRLDQDIYAYLLDLARNPILWLATVIFIGEISSRHRSRIRELAQLLAAAEQRERTVDTAYRKVAAAKSELEVRVAGQMKTVVALHQAAKAIDRARPEEVLLGVDKIVQAILNPRQYSVHLLEGRTLTLKLAEGWLPDSPYAKSYSAHTPIFRTVVGEQKMLCSVNREDQAALGREGILAGPLISPDNGEVFGMLKVEDIGFLDFSHSLIENFRITCDWIATAYAQALRLEQAEAGSAYSVRAGLFAAGFRERQIRIITDLARRIGFDLSALQLRLGGAEKLPPDRRAAIAADVGLAVRDSLRETDLAFEHARSGWEFEVLLPATGTANAHLVADKLRSALQILFAREGVSLDIQIAVQSLNEALPAPGRLSTDAAHTSTTP